MIYIVKDCFYDKIIKKCRGRRPRRPENEKTTAAVLGTMLSSFIPENISNVLNILVGILIIFFGIKMIFKKEK